MRRVDIDDPALIRAAGERCGAWVYHLALEGHPYLGGGCYELTPTEIEVVQEATAACHDMALAVLDAEIARADGWRRFGLPAGVWPFVQTSWDRSDDLPAVLVRFDFAPVCAADGTLTGVVLLEANAQTPTTLPETAGFQWEVVQATWPGAGQWNGLWDRLVEAWVERIPYLKPGVTAFCWDEGDSSGEDACNVVWQAEAASVAAEMLAATDADPRLAAAGRGFRAVTGSLASLELVDAGGAPVADRPGGIAGLSPAERDGCWYRAGDQRVENLVLLAPWEDVLARPGGSVLVHLSTPPALHPGAAPSAGAYAGSYEGPPENRPLGAGPFGSRTPGSGPARTGTIETIRVVEPLWKVCYSNKALMALLWEHFPASPYLVECFADGPRHLDAFVRKPLFSREGANVSIHLDGRIVAEGTDHDYGAEGHVWQRFVDIPAFPTAAGGAARPVFGAWVIGDEACGLGIRETPGRITNNGAAFASHRIVDAVASTSTVEASR
jgi:glutathionylspermidine synthase